MEALPSNIAASVPSPCVAAELLTPRRVALFFGGAIVARSFLTLVLLGAGATANRASAVAHLLESLVALLCIRRATQRARSIARLFWLLFALVFLFILLANTVWLYDLFSDHINVPDTDLRLLYRLAGAPILMLLFLPGASEPERTTIEVCLDLSQVAVVVSLAYFTFFYLPTQHMTPSDALPYSIRLSNLQNGFLFVATFTRMRFARQPAHRELLLRVWIYLLVYSIVNFLGNRVDMSNNAAAATWFNLCWDLPYAAGALIAISWKPSDSAPAVEPETSGFFSFLLSNFALVALLSCAHMLADSWQVGLSRIFVNLAVAITFLAFAIRLALTQYHQQSEITQRKNAERETLSANRTISALLDEARCQTGELSQMNEIGSLLQACNSNEEVFKVIPERLSLLFPRTSGSIALINPSRNHVERPVGWGLLPPHRKIIGPGDCWCLRRGQAHAVSAGESSLRCQHLMSNGAAVCVPLLARGEALGTLTIQEDAPDSGLATAQDATSRRRQLVSTVAEHVALAISNLQLRETLRTQAVRDPLTGLYNRRHMQEVLEREIHRSGRRRRPLAVMMLDLDNFKRYNDTYGHSEGDFALRMVGETLIGNIRTEDLACRYGGEEFVVILVECSLSQAMVRANEIRQRIRALRVDARQHLREAITVSIGVAVFGETTDQPERVLASADEALYQAKGEGRDRVVAARAVL